MYISISRTKCVQYLSRRRRLRLLRKRKSKNILFGIVYLAVRLQETINE